MTGATTPTGTTGTTGAAMRPILADVTSERVPPVVSELFDPAAWAPVADFADPS